jgi:hypothetical protein
MQKISLLHHILTFHYKHNFPSSILSSSRTFNPNYSNFTHSFQQSLKSIIQMGPKPGTRTGNGRRRTQRGGGVRIGSDMVGILVEELLLVNDYDRYINEFHNSRLTSSQFFCDIDAIDSLGFGFKDLLVYQNLGTFLGLKNSYDSSQIKAFYCVAERQQDNVSLCAHLRIVW